MADHPAAPTPTSRPVAPVHALLGRRRLLAIGGGVAAAGLLGHRVAGATVPPADGSRPPGAGDGRLVDTVNGEITVPNRAARVVCCDFASPLLLIDLGLVPTGVIADVALGEYVDDLDAVPIIGDYASVDYEAIAGLEPDLIVFAGYEAEYDRLAAIAPTFQTPDAGAVPTWQEFAAAVAEVLGRDGELVALEERYRRDVQAVVDSYGTVLAEHRFAVIGTYDGLQAYYLDTTSGTVQTVADCGAALSSATLASDTGVVQFSSEQWELLADADVLLLQDLGVPVTVAGALDALQEVPLFQRLPAVSAGRTYVIDVEVSSYGTASSLVETMAAVAAELDGAAPVVDTTSG